MRGKKLLMTWEAGAFLGHRMLVASAAGLMAAQGHKVTVAAPLDAPAPFDVLPDGLDWQCCVPPLASTPDHRLAFSWESRATSLWHAGFQSPTLVAERLKQWRALLVKFQPDLCLLQAAPFAQIASRAVGIPSVEFGIGFDVPPKTALFPPFRGRDTFDAAQATTLEQRIRDAVFAAEPSLATANAPLSHLVAGDTRLVTSIAELDHYDGAPGRQFVGPLPLPELAAASGAEDRWPQRSATQRRILAYLRHESVDLGRMLQAIASVDGGTASAVVVCTDALPAHADQALALGIRLHRAPLALTTLLPQTDVVISHGGGLMAEALVRGRPCVVLPSHFEQFMAAKQAARHQLAVVVNPADPQNWAAAIQHALRTQSVLRACQAAQNKYRAHVAAPGTAFLKAIWPA